MEKVYAPLADTQVDALFWCMGTHEATWLSENIPVVGDTVDRMYGTVRSMRDTENLRAMLERGEDPYPAMVDRGREHGIDVWNSIRMNDNHFWDIDSLEAMQTCQVSGPDGHASASPRVGASVTTPRTGARPRGIWPSRRSGSTSST